MLLKYFYDKKLAQASYLVGCAATGEALVIDPARDISPYLEAARAEGLRITHITETHIHADFVSGSRELASQTGATLYLSDMGDVNWKYQFADDNTVLIQDGDSWMVGNIRVEVLATPGHTPEHLVFQITDTAAADEPMGLFTGDFIFVGAVGRPDLLERAAGYAGTMVIGARQQYQNIQRMLNLPDYLQIWPGHGAGSACGKALGALPSTTLGYEKRFNPAFQFTDEDSFVEWLLEGQPEPPTYFAQMKKVNKVGPALLYELPSPVELTPAQLEKHIADGHMVIDTRDGVEFANGHLAGTLNIPASSNGFNTYAGWYIDYTQPVYLIVEADRLDAVIRDLQAIGIDKVVGYITPDRLSNLSEITPQYTHQQVAALDGGVQFLDIRNLTEYQEKHIPNALHIPMGYIARHLDQISRTQPVVVHCATGIRSQVVASLLQRYGFNNIINLEGGVEAWQAAGLPLEEGEIINA
ncbi:MAG: MBL fold metallo-hydrolase [Anaerolineales bacterium]|nr:MBL fold metallo-hydrolase [Anaerolineales bacterium]